MSSEVPPADRRAPQRRGASTGATRSFESSAMILRISSAIAHGLDHFRHVVHAHDVGTREHRRAVTAAAVAQSRIGSDSSAERRLQERLARRPRRGSGARGRASSFDAGQHRVAVSVCAWRSRCPGRAGCDRACTPRRPRTPRSRAARRARRRRRRGRWPGRTSPTSVRACASRTSAAPVTRDDVAEGSARSAGR